MIRFSAINQDNNTSRDNVENVSSQSQHLSIEAQEANAIRLYEDALRSQQNANYLHAQQLYHELLNSPLISHIKSSSKKSVLSSTMAIVKYSTLKNMATIYENLNDHQHAFELLSLAVDLDGRDVVVWHNIGRLGLRLSKWNISRIAFEKAIQIVPQHWLSIERLMELLFIIGDHDACWSLIERVLSIEPRHQKSRLVSALLLRSDPVKSEQIEVKEKVSSLIKEYSTKQLGIPYLKSLVEKKQEIEKQRQTSFESVSSQIQLSTQHHTLSKVSWDAFQKLIFTIYQDQTQSSSDPLDIYRPIDISLNQSDLNDILNINQQQQQNNVDKTTTTTTTTIVNNESTTTSTTSTAMSTSTSDINNEKVTDIQQPTPSTIISNDTTINNSNLPEGGSEDGGILLSPQSSSSTVPITPTSSATTTTTTVTPLNSSSGTIKTPVATTRRMETRSKTAKDDKSSDLIEEYFERLISNNRPISNDVLQQLIQCRASESPSLPESTSSKSTITKSTLQNNDSNIEKNLVYKFINTIKKDNNSSSSSSKPMSIDITDSAEKMIVDNEEESSIEQQQQPTILEWMIEFLNQISKSSTEQTFNQPQFISKLEKMKTSIEKYYTQQQQQQQQLSTSQNNVNTVPTTKKVKINTKYLKPNQDLTELSFNLQKLAKVYPTKIITTEENNPEDKQIFEDDDVDIQCKIRYKWLLARYTRQVLGDINLASIYFQECERLFDRYQELNQSSKIKTTTLTIHHIKHDSIISKIHLSQKISILQDQQQKNAAGQLFNTKNFTSVINLLEPLFPDSLCSIGGSGNTDFTLSLSPNSSANNNNISSSNNIIEFKIKEHVDSQTKSKINMIDLLLQSFLNLSDTKGVLKMSIILLKELSSYINQPEFINNYYTLLKTVFKHENMKPKSLSDDETSSTLLSILIRILQRFYKKQVSYLCFSLFIQVFNFDLDHQLKPPQLLSLYLMVHNDMGKKKICQHESSFLLEYIEIIFKFLINDDMDVLDVSEYFEVRPDQLVVKLITEISQCFYCLYSVKLMNNIDDHGSKLNLPLKSPSLLMQLFVLMKIMTGDEEDINIPLNPIINHNIDSINRILQPLGNKREFKELAERIYTKFQQPPERVTKYKSIIENYLNGESDSISINPETGITSDNNGSGNNISVVSSPPRINLEILFNMDENIDINDPLFDDIYTDIYYMQASHNEKNENTEFVRELIIKDLYCNPNRIDSWELLAKFYQDDLSKIATNDGMLRLKLAHQHLSKLKPKEDTSISYIGFLCYERCYFIPNTLDPAIRLTRCRELWNESLLDFQKAYAMDPANYYYPYMIAKIQKKLGEPPSVYFETLHQVIQSLPPLTKKKESTTIAVNILYRLHVDRLKLLLPIESNQHLDSDLLTFFEKYNYTLPSHSSTSTSSATNSDTESTTETTTEVTITSENQPKIQQPQQPSLEMRRELLVENSLSVLWFCKTLINYHHQSSYRIAWTTRYSTFKEDAIPNALNEMVKLLKPKMSRLSKACVWSIWNEGYLGDGKLDRYFKKYYSFYIQLLTENNDYKNLEIVFFKIKNEARYSIEAKHNSSTTSSPSSSNNNNNNNNNIQNEIETILKQEWDLYGDLNLFPEHKETISKLLIDSYIIANQLSPQKHPPHFDDVIQCFEKKFLKTDKKKKKPLDSTSTVGSTTTTSGSSSQSSISYGSDSSKIEKVSGDKVRIKGLKFFQYLHIEPAAHKIYMDVPDFDFKNAEFHFTKIGEHYALKIQNDHYLSVDTHGHVKLHHGHHPSKHELFQLIPV
eukprot:gene5315-6620_t